MVQTAYFPEGNDIAGRGRLYGTMPRPRALLVGCFWSATSRSTASRSARSARASSGFTSIPATPRGSTATRSSTRISCLDRLMAARIEGVDAAENDAILEELYAIGERREFIYEHAWQLIDFLMWDNRCSIHARTDFPKHERRCCAAAPSRAIHCRSRWRKSIMNRRDCRSWTSSSPTCARSGQRKRTTSAGWSGSSRCSSGS
jgi:hypothetical protein